MKEKNMRVIRRSPGFVGLDPAALRMLSASIRQVTFHPGEVICTQGDVLGELLILEVCVCLTPLPQSPHPVARVTFAFVVPCASGRASPPHDCPQK